ncbi:MAG: apolipoprotein N-acyltransferase [Rhodospirillales bacterium]|jgi:apolipoprotein N-acyltransferase|nr:apolipoprotein N-acyltransferase [Rhodospirillales bacterium]MBT4005549.1 apolipoprotein N-acyltransferase [Rhodospirillales bacterium]MBT5076297.1 apolipoprotein N-acyltransferase [Rhodospirillales bacterium]MBT5112268.1 apolipoprotein N-acyltransferase [Rhodospirillales bacterium]MBT5671969.1 apolipoprotein N-acyltransferase [Rhodospirillales bacterium]
MISAVEGMARHLQSIVGWHRGLVAVLLGGFAVLALPPVYLVPALFVSFTGLVWLIDGSATKRDAFFAGWWFGFGHFVCGLYWITNALLVDAAQYGILAPFAVAGLSLGFALFPALAAMAAFRAPQGFGRVVILALSWAVMEWVRGTILTGFSWNLIATAFAFSPLWIQSVSVIGSYGLSLVVVFLAALPSTLSSGERAHDGGIRARFTPVLFGLVVFGLLIGGGAVRLGQTPIISEPAAFPKTRLRIVQANIDQRLKWQRNLGRAHFEKYLRLTHSPGPVPGQAPDVVIWPETAVPFTLNGSDRQIRTLMMGVPKNGLLITGAVRTTPPGIKPFRVRNSLVALNAKGIIATYDKHHLVPFGEYVPLGRYLPLNKITAGRTDFTAGPGPRTLSLPGLAPFSPLVCYEAIFPGRVTASSDLSGPRPRWLLNVTNDAWFGRSSGPYQHLAAARMRAVEEGLPMVRAANTGISAVYDAYGHLLGSLPLGVGGVLDVALPPSLAQRTIFSKTGNISFAILLALVLLFYRMQLRIYRPV